MAKLHVAQIVTFGTLAAKAALRDVGRVFGLNTKELEQLSRLIPSRLGINLQQAYKESKQLQSLCYREKHIKQRLFETALSLKDCHVILLHMQPVWYSVKSHLSNLIPIQAGHNDIYLTQYSMEHLEEIGLTENGLSWVEKFNTT